MPADGGSRDRLATIRAWSSPGATGPSARCRPGCERGCGPTATSARTTSCAARTRSRTTWSTRSLPGSARVTVIVPPGRRPVGPDIAAIRGVRSIRAERIDEDVLRAAGLAGAAGLALMQQDDVGNIHIALTAQEIAPDVRVVMRMFNTGLGYGVKRLLGDCEVISDAAMAAPTFVAAALGELAPTHFHHLGRTLFVARREDVRPGAGRLRPGRHQRPAGRAHAAGRPGQRRRGDRRGHRRTGRRGRRGPADHPLTPPAPPVPQRAQGARLASSPARSASPRSAVLAVGAIFGYLLSRAEARGAPERVAGDVLDAADRDQRRRRRPRQGARRPAHADRADRLRPGADPADHRRGRRGHGQRPAGA